METKEAIEKVISVFDDWVLEYSCSARTSDEKEEEKNNIISLLKQGEENKKYKHIWKAFKKVHGGQELDVWDIESKFGVLLELMDDFEKKYLKEEII